MKSERVRASFLKQIFDTAATTNFCAISVVPYLVLKGGVLGFEPNQRSTKMRQQIRELTPAPPLAISCSCARHKLIWMNGSLILLILNLGNRWSLVVSFKTTLLYPRCPLNTRLFGPQNWCGQFGGNKHLLALPQMFHPYPTYCTGYPKLPLTVKSCNLIQQWFPMCDPGTRSQGIRGYISVITPLQFILLIKGIIFC